MTHTVPSTGPALNIGTIVNALLDSDGTISLQGQRYNGAGILVAIPEHGEVISLGFHSDDAIRELVSEWVEDNAHAITAFPAPFHRPRYYGIWSENCNIYLDIVEAFPREELTDAIAAGISRNQIAIWDNGRQELIDTNGTGAVD